MQPWNNLYTERCSKKKHLKEDLLECVSRSIELFKIWYFDLQDSG